MLVASLLVAATPWIPDLWLGRGNVWTHRVPVTVSNVSTNADRPTSVPVKLPVDANRVDLRLVDSAGRQLEYGALKDGRVVIPAIAPAGGSETYYVYWDNPDAWRLGDFWPRRAEKGDAPKVSVGAVETLEAVRVGDDAPWAAAPAGSAWCWRVPVRLVNLTDEVRSGMLSALNLTDVRRAARNPQVRLECRGRELETFTCGDRLFFTCDLPPKSVVTCWLYVREGGTDAAAAVAKQIGNTVGELTPSDQQLVTEETLSAESEARFAAFVASSNNLVRNPSFELGETGWTRSGPQKGCRFSVADGGRFGGKCAELAVAADAEPGWRGFRQDLTVLPGREYFIGGYVAGENLEKDARISFHVFGQGKTTLMESTGDIGRGTFPWKHAFGTVRVPEGYSTLSLLLTMNQAGTLRHDGLLVIGYVPAFTGDPETPAPAASAPLLSVAQVSTVRKVFRETLVRDTHAPFSIALAKGETEELQVAVRVGRPIARLEVDAPALTGPDGARLAVSVGHVRHVPVDAPTAYYSCVCPERELRFPRTKGNSDGWSGWWPDPIVAERATAARPADTESFRFAVTTAAETPAGDYVGELVWKADGREVRRDRVRVRVWNFTLPARPEIPAIYDIRGSRARWLRPGDKPDADVRDRMERLMAEKKLCPDRIRADVKLSRDASGKVVADFAEWDRAAERYFNGLHFAHSYLPGSFYLFGWGFPPKVYLGEKPYEGDYPWADVDRTKLRPQYVAVYQEALRLVWNHVREKGWADRMSLYLCDEPHMHLKGVVDQMKALCAMIRAVDSKIPIYVSTWGHCKEWDGSVNLWGIGHYGVFPPEEIRERCAAGDGFWFTTDGQQCMDTVYATTERLYPHYCRVWGASAYEFWGFDWLTYDPWEYGWHCYRPESQRPGESRWVRYPAGDGYLVYPPKPGISDGYSSSIRLEAARDGVEDYSYLRALERLTEKGGERGKSAAALLEEHRQLLPIPNAGGRYSSRILSDPEILDRLRHRAGELLGAN